MKVITWMFLIESHWAKASKQPDVPSQGRAEIRFGISFALSSPSRVEGVRAWYTNFNGRNIPNVFRVNVSGSEKPFS